MGEPMQESKSGPTTGRQGQDPSKSIAQQISKDNEFSFDLLQGAGRRKSQLVVGN